MSSEDLLLRKQKLQEIRAMGINPYPHHFQVDHQAQPLHDKYEGQPVASYEDALSQQGQEVSIAGRLILFRAMGKNAFAQLLDPTGTIQVVFSKGNFHVQDLEEPGPISAMKFVEKKIDLGDILGLSGHLFRTQKGELTLFVKQLTLLSKTLLPLPDKYAGLHDKETRYRKRWLDLIANPDVKKTFQIRSQIFKIIRDFFEQRSFMEVETPVLQSLYGGAEARPFTTKLHALDQEMFLRISLEIPLKKLLVGGLPRIFEIGKVFRNEGIDRNHNPEFTLLEAYAAHFDYHDMMHLVEKLFETIAIKLFGTTKVLAWNTQSTELVEIDMKAPWKRITMHEAIAQYSPFPNFDSMSDEELKQALARSGHIAKDKLTTMNRGLLVAALFEIFAEPHLIEPHHILDHPIETTPFCKLHRHKPSREQGIVERFESFILHQEVCNAYTELNDPELQEKLLKEQSARRDSGDLEAAPYDAEFIEAIQQGMPPAGGVGIGLDRLVMLFTQAHTIREVLYFPWMKPEA